MRVEPLTPALGAEVDGVDLAELDDAGFDELHRALLDRAVLVVRDQHLDREAQLALGRRFGELEVHPIADGLDEHPEIIRVHKPAGEPAYFGTAWHTDNTFFERPSAVTILYGETVPPLGGDTLFASMTAAYATLDDTLVREIDGRTAVHSAARAYDPETTGAAKYRGETAITYTFSDAIYTEVEHPVVRHHPETGVPALFVNPMFTLRVVDLPPADSDALLRRLHRHAVRPEHTCRVRWRPGTVTIWDNRCVQHYAIDDYPDHERVMYRVTVAGDRPV